MGVRILSGPDGAALYDERDTRLVPSPMFTDAEEAQAFLDWFAARKEPSPLTTLASTSLAGAVSEFRLARYRVDGPTMARLKAIEATATAMVDTCQGHNEPGCALAVCVNCSHLLRTLTKAVRGE